MYLYSLDEKNRLHQRQPASQPPTQHNQTHTNNPKSIKLGYRQRMLYREGVRKIPGTAHGAYCDCHQPTKLDKNLNNIPLHLARPPSSLSLSLPLLSYHIANAYNNTDKMAILPTVNI